MQPVILPIDFGERQVPYQEGWELQRRIHRQVVTGETPPTIVVLEHQHVYTAGSRTQMSDRPAASEPVVDVDRGGRITWHGPGQVVAYPIIPLPEPLDVVAYVRRLEDALIATCADFGLETTRIQGRSGVWLTDEPGGARKIAAIGVRVSRGTTLHGVALNVNCDLSKYQAIVPCGIADAGVTSVAAEGCHAPLTEVGVQLGSHLVDFLSWG